MNALSLFMSGKAASVAADNVRAKASALSVARYADNPSIHVSHNELASAPVAVPSVQSAPPMTDKAESTPRPTHAPATAAVVRHAPLVTATQITPVGTGEPMTAPQARPAVSPLIAATSAIAAQHRLELPLFATGADPDLEPQDESEDEIRTELVEPDDDAAAHDVPDPESVASDSNVDQIHAMSILDIPNGQDTEEDNDVSVPVAQEANEDAARQTQADAPASRKQPAVAPLFDAHNGPLSMALVAAAVTPGKPRQFLLTVRAFADEAAPICTQFEVQSWTNASDICVALRPALEAALAEYLAVIPARQTAQVARAAAQPAAITTTSKVTTAVKVAPKPVTRPVVKPVTKPVPKPLAKPAVQVDVLTLF